jgi:peptide deformylase
MNIVSNLVKDIKENHLPMRYYPDDILTKTCLPVEEITPEIQTFIGRLYLSMKANNGLGIAAPQLGKLLNIFVIDVEGAGSGFKNSNPLIFINPKIELLTEELLDTTEGCLSFPGIFAKTKRCPEVRVTALDYDGNSFTETFFNYDAVAIQHEFDHLNGKTIREHLPIVDRNRVLNNIKKIQRENKRRVK